MLAVKGRCGMEAVITARIDSSIKDRASKVMEDAGLSPSQAVRKFFGYVAEEERMPFEESTPLTRSQIEARVAAFDRCHTKKPLDMTDDQLKQERLESRYGV